MDKPSYVMIPRRWITVWLLVTIGLFVESLGSYMYTNHVAKQLCGVITLSNDAYKKNPNPSITGRTLIEEFDKLVDKYNC